MDILGTHCISTPLHSFTLCGRCIAPASDCASGTYIHTLPSRSCFISTCTSQSNLIVSSFCDLPLAEVLPPQRRWQMPWTVLERARRATPARPSARTQLPSQATCNTIPGVGLVYQTGVRFRADPRSTPRCTLPTRVVQAWQDGPSAPGALGRLHTFVKELAVGSLFVIAQGAIAVITGRLVWRRPADSITASECALAGCT